MARRRYQRGRVFLRGKRNPVWVRRWREDVIQQDGSVNESSDRKFSRRSKNFRRNDSPNERSKKR